MLAMAGRTVLSVEAALTNGGKADTAESFLRLAGGELDRAYRLAGLILGDQHEAEDATQDALFRAWRAGSTLREADGFRTWFDRILVNVCRDRLRRQGTVRLVAVDGALATRAAGDPFRTILDRDEVVRAMASRDDDLRIVIVLA